MSKVHQNKEIYGCLKRGRKGKFYFFVLIEILFHCLFVGCAECYDPKNSLKISFAGVSFKKKPSGSKNTSFSRQTKRITVEHQNYRDENRGKREEYRDETDDEELSGTQSIRSRRGYSSNEDDNEEEEKVNRKQSIRRNWKDNLSEPEIEEDSWSRETRESYREDDDDDEPGSSSTRSRSGSRRVSQENTDKGEEDYDERGSTTRARNKHRSSNELDGDSDEDCLPNISDAYREFEDYRQKWIRKKLLACGRILEYLKPIMANSQERFNIADNGDYPPNSKTASDSRSKRNSKVASLYDRFLSEAEEYGALLKDKSVQKKISLVADLAARGKKVESDRKAFQKNAIEYSKELRKYTLATLDMYGCLLKILRVEYPRIAARRMLPVEDV